MLVNGDLLDEANETFSVNLSNPANATIADGAGHRHDHGRRPAGRDLRRRRQRPRGQLRDGERHVHRLALDAPAAGRSASTTQPRTGPPWLRSTIWPRPGRSTSPRARRRSRSRCSSTATCSTKQRDLLPQPLERRQRNDCGRPGPRHDHERRRPTQPVRQRRNGDRRRLGHDERHLHRHAGSSQWAERECGLLDRGWYGDRTRRLRRDEWHAHVRPGPDHEDRDGPGRGRHARRARRDLHVNLSNAVNAAIADGTGLGHDPRRRPAAGALGQRRDGDRARTRARQRDLHGQPQRAERLAISVDYATADGTATAPARLRRRLRHPHVRGRRDLEAGHRARSTATCSTRRTRPTSSTSRIRRTRRSPTGRAWARSPTTTRCPRSRSTTSRSPRGTSGRPRRRTP